MRVDIIVAQTRHNDHVRAKGLAHTCGHHVVELEDLFGCSREVAVDIVPGVCKLESDLGSFRLGRDVASSTDLALSPVQMTKSTSSAHSFFSQSKV